VSRDGSRLTALDIGPALYNLLDAAVTSGRTATGGYFLLLIVNVTYEKAMNIRNSIFDLNVRFDPIDKADSVIIFSYFNATDASPTQTAVVFESLDRGS
jgi:hypothetical protein